MCVCYSADHEILSRDLSHFQWFCVWCQEMKHYTNDYCGHRLLVTQEVQIFVQTIPGTTEHLIYVCLTYTWLNELCHETMCLKIFVVVIPKEGLVGRAPPTLLLVWHPLRNIILENRRVRLYSSCHTQRRICGSLPANHSLGITTTKILHKTHSTENDWRFGCKIFFSLGFASYCQYFIINMSLLFKVVVLI